MSSEKIKDFIRPDYDDPVMDMWEFFNDNPHYTLLKYIPIKDGIRSFYTLLN